MRILGIAICVAVIGFFGAYAAMGGNFLSDPQKTDTQISHTKTDDKANRQPYDNLNEKSEHHQNKNERAANGPLSENDAKDIALKDANLNADSLQRLSCRKESDEGISYYDIDIYTGDDRMHYSYDIDATSGDIISKKYEINKGTFKYLEGQPMSEQQLRDMLAQKMDGVDVNRINIQRKKENILNVYEGKASSASTKYEFKVDAATGTIIEWEEEQRSNRH